MLIVIKKYVTKNQRFVKLVNSLDKKLLWNSVLRYTLTAYLNWAILAINNLFTLASEGPLQATLQTLLLIVVIVYPF